MNLSACPQLFKKLVETNSLHEEAVIKDTLKFLAIAKKFKVKKIGINTYADPELESLHKGFPFGTVNAVFTTKQYHTRFKRPVIWSVCESFANLMNEDIGGCGNHMQHSMLHPLYTGIYSFNDEKCEYEFYKV